MRVLQEFLFIESLGNKRRVLPGQLVDVTNRHMLKQLLAERKVGDKDKSHVGYPKPGPSAEALAKTLRVGVWLFTSNHYSGGRLHTFQYAWSLAKAGAEVFFITNARPIWANDYPIAENLVFISDRDGSIPDDLDIVFTDSKGTLGLRAAGYVRDHPGCKLVVLNFETSNWAQEFVPEMAARMVHAHRREAYGEAHLLLGNSDMSKDYLRKWMGEPSRAQLEIGQQYGVLPPAVNTSALDLPLDGVKIPTRPFAVWSARNTPHKGAPVAIEAIWGLDIPFDLVTFGQPASMPQATSLHQLWAYKNKPDAVKFTLMAKAQMVLAPSLFEGFGMVPAEALAAGTPCIIYELPVLTQNYGKRLISCKWKSKDHFIRKVHELAHKPKVGVANAQKWARETWGLNAMGERIEHLPFHAVKRKAVSALMNCYATPTAPLALEAIYPYVEQIVIVYGPVGSWSGYPENGTLDAIRTFPDPEHKIIIEARDGWESKLEMKSWAASRITGNYLLLLDADEIWVGLDKWLANKDTDWATPRWVNLWHNGKHWIHDAGEPPGSRWGSKLDPLGSVCRHYRFSCWRPSYRWSKHHTIVDHSGNVIHNPVRNMKRAKLVPGCVIYHLGHAMDKPLMEQKHMFYRQRDGAPASREAAWHKWNGKLGECGDGIIEKVDWELPEVIQRALELCKK